ncbi:nitroreductase family protein [Vibrio cholerae]|nr:nitroreductase family protein [Vibrio cholerae]
MRILIVRFLKKIMPDKWFNFLLIKPRLMLVDIHTAKQVKWLRKQSLAGVNRRGGEEAYLRKQAHVLEKGIQSFDREPGHSKVQYELVKSLLAKSRCTVTNEWANGIVGKYEALQRNELREEDIFIEPYISGISKEDFYSFTKARRSIRYFDGVKIKNELLTEIAELLNWSPNSCNRQTAKIYATEDKSLIEECMSLNGGATCMNMPSHFITLTCDTRAYMLPVEYNAAFIDASLAAQNFILGLHANGIGSCVLNWTHATQSQNLILKDKLSIPEHEIVIFNLVIGYPEKNIFPSSKKDINNTLIFR